MKSKKIYKIYYGKGQVLWRGSLIDLLIQYEFDNTDSLSGLYVNDIDSKFLVSISYDDGSEVGAQSFDDDTHTIAIFAKPEHRHLGYYLIEKMERLLNAGKLVKEVDFEQI